MPVCDCACISTDLGERVRRRRSDAAHSSKGQACRKHRGRTRLQRDVDDSDAHTAHAKAVNAVSLNNLFTTVRRGAQPQQKTRSYARGVNRNAFITETPHLALVKKAKRRKSQASTPRAHALKECPDVVIQRHRVRIRKNSRRETFKAKTADVVDALVFWRAVPWQSQAARAHGSAIVAIAVTAAVQHQPIRVQRGISQLAVAYAAAVAAPV